MVFLITYDLKHTEKDYTSLYNEIKESGTDSFHPLESVWFLKTEITINELTGNLRQVMEDDDMLFVVNITEQEMQGWLPRPAWEWIDSTKNK